MWHLEIETLKSRSVFRIKKALTCGCVCYTLPPTRRIMNVIATALKHLIHPASSKLFSRVATSRDDSGLGRCLDAARYCRTGVEIVLGMTLQFVHFNAVVGTHTLTLFGCAGERRIDMSSHFRVWINPYSNCAYREAPIQDQHESAGVRRPG